METKITCRLVKVRYRNEENGFTILVAKENRSGLECVLKGVMSTPAVDCDYAFTGEWDKDPKWGVGFKFTSCEQLMPTTKEGIMRYLCSEYVTGIGKKYAKIIVDTFGEKTIEVLDKDIDRLSRIKGIGKRRLESIRKSWRENQCVREIMVFLQSYGVSTSLAVKIYKEYGEDSISRVNADPYCLAADFAGVGFKTADAIARKMGYANDDERRCRAGVLYTLECMSTEGHVCALRDQLVKKTSQLLSVDEEPAEKAVDEMVRRESVVMENGWIYLTSLYYDEKYSADKIRTLAAIMDLTGHVPDMASIEEMAGMQYDEIQRDAIYTACSGSVTVLTGGPGTGKTTTVKGIILAFEKMGKSVLLAAPTGRAAKRMSEATGRDAQTIHRLLEYTPQSGWGRNAGNPLECDALIVDECSMIDISLMRRLLDAVSYSSKVVLVGDIDQLPSVGAGNCLRDIIESETVPVVRLERIFRQAMKSNIIMGAHAVNEGKLPDMSNNRESDFFFIEQDDPEKVAETVLELVETRIPEKFGFKTGDVQVLSPMRRGTVGTKNLNEKLQERLNTEKTGVKYGDVVFKKGDRVMQIRNNYDKGVFNGDVGTVAWADFHSNSVYVYYGETGVMYKKGELEEIVLAYATTIHKSQGSEYPVVIVPVMNSQHIMLQRNLIYTAITRAKKLCVMVGEKKALNYAVRNYTIAKRNSNLKVRLAGEWTENKKNNKK